MEIPLIGRGVQGRNRRISPSLLVNVYPEIHQGKLSNASLAGTAGLKQFADLGDDPIRALHEVDGVLYALAGTTLYGVSATGEGTAITGSIPTTVKPKVDDNGNQIVFPIGNGYVYDVSGNTVSQITDPDYLSSTSCCFIGQYISFIRDGTGEFFLSAFQDATDFDALDFATSESDPDNNVSNHQFQGNQWLFGTKSTEVWYVSGEAFPLNPYINGRYNVGCGARLSVASNEDYIVWVTNNRRIYASTGGKPVAISTPEVEYQLGLLSAINDGEGFIYSEEGRTFYQVSFAELTLVYDFDTQWWHEKRSMGGRHLAAHHVYVYGKNLVSDYRNGKIYHMSLDHGDDAGEIIVREGILPPIFGSVDSIELTAEMGITPLNENENKLELRWAPDGAKWSNWADKGLGAEGQTLKRLKWDGLRSDRTTYFHWRAHANSPFRLVRADA